MKLLGILLAVLAPSMAHALEPLKAIRVHNNSQEAVTVEVKKHSGEVTCEADVPKSTVILGPGEAMTVACETNAKTQCIRGVQAAQSKSEARWSEIDCSPSFSAVKDLNLFGR